MRRFMDDNFLLTNHTAVRLFRDYAREMPIIDYHCHLDPGAILENRSFTDLTQAWLSTDHYKWRAMRICGTDERLVTGDAQPREKFDAWVRTLPKLAGHPLFHWTHLELARYFGMEGTVLSEKTADSVWKEANRLLATDDFRVRNLLTRMKVRVLCTTDDPADTLERHAALASDPSLGFSVLPAFRPDKLFGIVDAAAFNAYLDRLGTACGFRVHDWDTLLAAVASRIEFFASRGCRASDHALLSTDFPPCPTQVAAAILRRVVSGEAVGKEDYLRFRSALLGELAVHYAARGWAMELHVGALRNVNAGQFARLGPDTGYDVIAPCSDIGSLAAFLGALEERGVLPRIILYNLNPAESEAMAALTGAFHSSIKGKIQYGAAWWFNDTKAGNARQIEILASYGVLGAYIGMLTDSRSFLSFPRHEYFRRILCDLIGRWVEAGEYPDDAALLEPLIKGICYENAKEYFGFEGID